MANELNCPVIAIYYCCVECPLPHAPPIYPPGSDPRRLAAFFFVFFSAGLVIFLVYDIVVFDGEKTLTDGGHMAAIECVMDEKYFELALECDQCGLVEIFPDRAGPEWQRHLAVGRLRDAETAGWKIFEIDEGDSGPICSRCHSPSQQGGLYA